jgi:hypothetical protein
VRDNKLWERVIADDFAEFRKAGLAPDDGRHREGVGRLPLIAPRSCSSTATGCATSASSCSTSGSLMPERSNVSRNGTHVASVQYLIGKLKRLAA